MVIGIGKGEHFLGSDASPMLEYTKEVVYINDYELAIVKPDELILKTWVTKNNSLRSKIRYRAGCHRERRLRTFHVERNL